MRTYNNFSVVNVYMTIKETIDRLNDRITKLENKSTETNFLNKMEELKNKQDDCEKIKRENEMASLVTIYKEGVSNNKLEIELSNLPKIVEYSIKFVEEFFTVASSILNVVFKSKNDKSHFKREMCLNLMNELFNIEDGLIPLIINTIDEIVMLVFNKDKYEVSVDKEVSRRKNKNNSVRKMKKIFLRF